MGVVYQAHDPSIDRLVALKVLRPDRVTDQAFVARFLKEAMAIGRLSHPGIVTVHDVGEDKGTVYIAMEYVTGSPLDEVIRAGKLSVEQSVEIACKVAEALHYAHERGIVHRDIKPSNILLNDNNETKITDFGIARIEDPDSGTMTQAGEILGTPVYMSPEQVKGQKVDGRSDLFSLAVILYELVVGKRPFGGNNLAAIFHSIANDNPDPPAEADPFISKRLSDTIIKALAKKPDQRFQSGREMAKALKTAVQRRQSSNVDTGKVSSRRGILVGLGAAALVVLLAAAWLVFKPAPEPIPHEPDVQKAILNVTSEPDGADIFVNGTFRGKTPLELQLPLGKYEIALNLDNYYEWEAQLEFDQAGPTPLHVRLVPIQ